VERDTVVVVHGDADRDPGHLPVDRVHPGDRAADPFERAHQHRRLGHRAGEVRHHADVGLEALQDRARRVRRGVDGVDLQLHGTTSL